jgi:hypothetical protein
MVQPEVIFIRWPARPSGLLRLDANSSMPPRVVRSSSEPPLGFWGPNPWNRPPMVLRPKPPNRPRVAYSIRVPRHSTRVTAVLDQPSAKGTYQPCVRNLPLDECIVNTNIRTTWAKEKKKKRKRELTQMTKSQWKTKPGSFKMSNTCKTWSPKT